MSEPYSHIWNGKEIVTVGDLIDAIGALGSREEAVQFIEGYRAVSEHADMNAGYVTGYLDAARADELREWMGTAHPIFGMKSPTPEAAFAMGEAWGERTT